MIRIFVLLLFVCVCTFGCSSNSTPTNVVKDADAEKKAEYKRLVAESQKDLEGRGEESPEN